MTVKRVRFLTKKGPSGEAGKEYTAIKGKDDACLFFHLRRRWYAGVSTQPAKGKRYV
ncbi:hypothetical protein K1J91_005021 [Salmonella enterica]|nr:hypothetical protein [Salmonella enterica]